MRKQGRNWASRYSKIWIAIRNGSIEHQPCEVCGNPKSEAHHGDYGQPLKVQWLCRTHHAMLHREIRHGCGIQNLGDLERRRRRKLIKALGKKHPKLLIRVSCTDKKFYLQPPPKDGANSWHVRFTPPKSIRQKRGLRERVYRTTGETNITDAKRKAKEIIESYWI